MGVSIKKIARPINKAKNNFVKWLGKNRAEDVDTFGCKSYNDWDYYGTVDGWIDNTIHSVSFMMWQGRVRINYDDGTNTHKDLSINDFEKLLD
jgi:hypothetical protein